MEQPNFEIHIINNYELFKKLVDFEARLSAEAVVVDVETDSEIEKKALLYGLGLNWLTKTAFYLVWRNKLGEIIWSNEERTEIILWLTSLFNRYKIINHNILYDTLVLENNLKIDLVPNIYSDTILQKHTLDEEPPFKLKEIAPAMLGEWATKAEDKLKENVIANGGKFTKDCKEMYKADTEILGEYCCWDVLLTGMIFEIFEKRLVDEGLYKFFYEDEVMPLYKEVTIDMKRRGFPIDIPYYEKLKSDISTEINRLEDAIMADINADVEVRQFCTNLLDEECPVKPKGNFPKVLAELKNIPLPINAKTGEVTMAAKELQKLIPKANPMHVPFYGWVMGTMPKFPYSQNDAVAVQEKIFFGKNPDQRYIFNLRSNDHLGNLICKIWGYPPLEVTEKEKKPKIDDDFLETIKNNPTIEKLLDYKKLNKLLSTYVEGILDRQLQGMIYTSMLQFGTTSGRYSSRDPNLQNQPRIKDEDSGLSPLVLKYVNAIRRGFIALPGYKVIGADYSALEPRCFAHVSGDERLRDVFRKGEDLYSRVAIDTFELDNISANPKDANYLKNVQPEFRQKSKVFCLAVPYGAEGPRMAEELKISVSEANKLIESYLNAYPELKKYMYRCDYSAKHKGFVQTEFGRIRHLKAAKSIYIIHGDEIRNYRWAEQRGLKDLRREYKNYLNLSKNFPIQGLAAHIVNRAMIAISREFKKHKIDGWIALQVHDEIICIVRENQTQLAVSIMKRCMEETTKISIPLIADPCVADNWADTK